MTKICRSGEYHHIPDPSVAALVGNWDAAHTVQVDSLNFSPLAFVFLLCVLEVGCTKCSSFHCTNLLALPTKARRLCV
jgi:hypothetical protein